MRTPDPSETLSPQASDMPEVVEDLFRREWGKIVATLTRIFGIERLALAEDVVQEALARALQTWPYYGIPENPSAWIMRVARNLALDQARREVRFRNKQEEIAGFFERSFGDPPVAQDEIEDDRLRMIFVCCHPEIPQEAQVALALRTLCGFNVAEIANAFLTSEAAIAKRLTRAKQRIRSARIPFEIPAGPELTARLNGVLQTLYLLFNEGYKASGGDRLIREELCHEAIRLTDLVAGHSAGNRPPTHALLALMYLNAARLSARTDSEGHILRLKEQNRSRWDKSMIAKGMFHLAAVCSWHRTQRISSPGRHCRVPLRRTRRQVDELAPNSLPLRSPCRARCLTDRRPEPGRRSSARSTVQPRACRPLNPFAIVESFSPIICFTLSLENSKRNCIILRLRRHISAGLSSKPGSRPNSSCCKKDSANAKSRWPRK